jgi:murein DD-endopeptidase MepM/ murein hydrolase activator NlpD
MFTLTHISRGARRRTVLALLSIALTAAVQPTAATASSASARYRSYRWPVKPFDRQHAVRGNFGDPRTIFTGPPTLDGLFSDGCQCSFHEGIDISAPDGTPVYPVESGTVTVVHNQRAAEMVEVTSGGRSFEYWHLRAAVHVGQKAEAGRTILGRVLRGAKHVHLTEVDGGVIVNPLQAGHLTPYADRTKPSVESISLRQIGTGRTLLANFVRSSVEIVAEAYDTPSVPVPGQWNGMPVTPALVTWRIQTLSGGVVLPEHVAVDFRSTIPSSSLFWTHYARGTYQNMSVFGTHFSWRQPGCFLFKLTRSAFDTRAIRDGVYDLVVTATDIGGNTSSLSKRFTIHNRDGWVGS